jgi:hypothetical protein
VSGAAFNARGATEAGMGVASGDIDADGRVDLFVTNLDFETNTLYRNDGAAFFTDITEAAGLATPSQTHVGFGTVLLDADHDGDLDLFVGNGHILDNIARQNPTLAYAQPDQLFDNRDGTFVEVSDAAGAYFSRPTVTRGASAGDVDGDGALDLLLSASNGPATLLRNVAARGDWLLVRLLTRDGRAAIGARVTVRSGSLRQVRETQAGSSYLSQNDLRLHFGLGVRGGIGQLEVWWPLGSVSRLDAAALPANRVLTLVEPESR